MKNPRSFQERKLTGAHWFWFLAILGLVTRIPLLGLNTAETTDGVWSLTYFSPAFLPNDRFVIFPGYPFILYLAEKLGVGGWYFGRLVSALAGIFFLIPLWKFSRRWMSLDMSGIVCAMALFSPLLWQWSLKVMPDVFFLLFFWLCLERLAAWELEQKQTAWVVGNLSAAVAACTRPEGYLLFPWVLILAEKWESGSKWVRRLWLAAAWAGPALLLKPKILTIIDAYREGLGLNSGPQSANIPLLNFMEHLYAYLAQPVYIFTPLVYWFAILGLGKMVRRKEQEGSIFRGVILQVYAVLFISRLFPTGYQDRYLLPYLPLLTVAAGVHLESFFEHWKNKKNPIKHMFLKNGLLVFCLAWLTLYSAASLISQNDSFGDVKRSSEFLKTLPPNAVLFSDEIQKTQFWSGRKPIPVVLPFVPPKGCYVVLHSCYTPRINFVSENMKRRFGAEIIRQDYSMVVPILTDLMQEQNFQNRVAATAFRFQPQFFQTLVFHVK